MRFEGRVWKDRRSGYWLIEVPLLDIMTQATSKKSAYWMIADAIKVLIGRKDFKVDVRPSAGSSFTIGANQEGTLFALMLKRQREAHNLTLLEMAHRLDSKSPNAYARYEQGRSIPTIEKLNQLMKAINPELEPTLKTG
jgi:predicted RNase H-like HicB family nuclease